MTDHQRIVQDIIPAKLKEIEARENIRVIHCIESGSRAWGFASPDSDYDVRFIYVRPLEYYLRLDKTRDVIEWQLDDTLDINGWDLQKALRLLHSSNPTLLGRDFCNHRPLFPEESWPLSLSQYRQEKLPRIPQGRSGPAEKVFLCATAYPGLPLDSGEANTTTHAFLHTGRCLP